VSKFLLLNLENKADHKRQKLLGFQNGITQKYSHLRQDSLGIDMVRTLPLDVPTEISVTPSDKILVTLIDVSKK
jgi:hypothetical protein